MNEEIKKLIEDGNKTIDAIRSELDGVKKEDALSKEKLVKMEKDLTATLESKSALEKRLEAIETLNARPRINRKVCSS